MKVEVTESVSPVIITLESQSFNLGQFYYLILLTYNSYTHLKMQSLIILSHRHLTTPTGIEPVTKLLLLPTLPNSVYNYSLSYGVIKPALRQAVGLQIATQTEHWFAFRSFRSFRLPRHCHITDLYSQPLGQAGKSGSPAKFYYTPLCVLPQKLFNVVAYTPAIPLAIYSLFVRTTPSVLAKYEYRR